MSIHKKKKQADNNNNLELKNKITTVKISLQGFNSEFDLTEEKSQQSWG